MAINDISSIFSQNTAAAKKKSEEIEPIDGTIQEYWSAQSQPDGQDCEPEGLFL